MNCSICGKEIVVGELRHDFGEFELPIGEGEYVEIGISKVRPGTKIVEWNGESETVHYVECGTCFINAQDGP